MSKSGAVLLEPIMKVEITTPEDYMGDVIGDINSRRGRIESINDIGGGKLISTHVPLSEMFGYATDLRSKNTRTWEIILCSLRNTNKHQSLFKKNCFQTKNNIRTLNIPNIYNIIKKT